MRILMPAARRFDDARDEIAQNMTSRLREAAHRIELGGNSLELASPRSVLARGYSIVRKPAPEISGAQSATKNASILGEGAIVRSSSQLEADDRLTIVFSEGNALVDVREVTI